MICSLLQKNFTTVECDMYSQISKLTDIQTEIITFLKMQNNSKNY